MEYWRRTVFVPFLDHLLQELDNRFSQLSQDAIKGFCLIPPELPRLSESDITTLFERFKDDLPSPSSFNQEIRRWKMLWSNIEHSPSTLVDTLGSNHYVPRSYLNIATIFHVLSVTPVTTASTERANSALKFIKNDRISTMGQERLNSLLMSYVHKDIVLDSDTVIDLYASWYPRRMKLLKGARTPPTQTPTHKLVMVATEY